MLILEKNLCKDNRNMYIGSDDGFDIGNTPSKETYSDEEKQFIMDRLNKERLKIKI